jgi:hypothetical protein
MQTYARGWTKRAYKTCYLDVKPSWSSGGGEESNRNLDVFPSRPTDILICIGMEIVTAERDKIKL